MRSTMPFSLRRLAAALALGAILSPAFAVPVMDMRAAGAAAMPREGLQ